MKNQKNQNQKQTETETTETIETAALENVIGGCAACTNGQIAPCCKGGQCTQA